MRLLLCSIPLLAACITDDGEIEKACDEVEEPCIWEETADPRDTGSGADKGAEADR